MSPSSGEPSDVYTALQRYYAVLDSRDPDGFAGVIASDMVFDDDALRRSEVRGVEAFSALFAGLWQAIPDLTFSTLNGPFIAEDNARCMVHIGLSGTVQTPLPELGRVDAQGHIDFDMMALYEVRDNKIAYIRVCCDPSALDRQLSRSVSVAEPS